MRRLLIAAAAAVVVGTLVAGVVLARDVGPAAPTAAGGSGLALSGTDVVTGDRVELASFAGKPVVVNIWASWCSGCNAEAAALARFAEANPDVGFLGINFQDTTGAARAFHARYDWKFASIFDPEGELAFELGLQGTPTTIFLDAGHNEVARIVGETDEAGFAEGLRRATQGS